MSVEPRHMHRLFPAAMLAILAGCATTDQLAPPVDATMLGAAAIDGQAPETLSRGRRVYLTKCTHCHSPERVTDYPLDRWPDILSVMSERAHLDERERADVLAYVLAVTAM